VPLTQTPPESVSNALQALSNGAGSASRNGHAGGNGHKPAAQEEHDTEAPKAPRISAPADIAADGSYGVRWLIVDETDVRVVTPAEDGEAHVDISVPLADIVDARSEMLVGMGVLVVVLRDGRTVEMLRYTVSTAPVFSAAARAIQSYCKDEAPPESLTLGLEKKRCPRCGDPLPDDSNVCVKCVDKRAVLVRLLAYTSPYRGRAILVACLMLIGTASSLIPPILQRHLTDDVLVPHRNLNWLAWIVALNLIVSISQYAFSIWRGRVAAWMSLHMVYTIRSEIYGKLQQLSLGYYDKRQTGTLVARVTQDVNELQQFMVDGLQFFLVNTLTIVGILVILFANNWKLTLLVLIPVPLTIVLTRVIWRRLWGMYHRVWFLRSRLSGSINAAFSGVRVVKAFAQETREIERFEEKSFNFFNAGVRVEQASSTYFPILGFITTIGLYIIWYVGGLNVYYNRWNLAENGMTLGVLGMFLSYIHMLMAPLQGMTRVADWMSRSAASAERVFEVIDTEPDVSNVAEPVRMPHITGRVELKNVRFSYDKNQNVLEDISIDVEPGEMIGLVGHSGAGKSTIINLLSRFYDVRDGQILIDGVDIREIHTEDLRKQVGVVLQEPFLFPGTIKDNIAYAKPGASIEEIMRVAKAANAHDFIMRMADGYDTYVGERGARLSGGERQRLSIARAILHDPRILILDEATASVDTETEKQIQEAIGRLIEGRTTFAIAHRLSTLRNASRLMVMERGKLVELGTHQELLDMPDGVFRRLVNMQQEVNQIRAV
jgi:ATP-binding cassette subfamily B protein